MTFQELNIKQSLKDQLSKIGFSNMTEIQSGIIDFILEGHDVIGQAPTGTGKTFSFAVPLVSKTEKGKGLQNLVICPTRELANQVCTEFKKIATDINIISVFGGQEIVKQIRLLKNNPEIIVGTPGRLLDLIDRRLINPSFIKTIVLDEADEMFDMGFINDIKKIFSMLKPNHQTVLISATMPKAIIELTNQFLKQPKFYAVKIDEESKPQITQYYAKVDENKKISLIKDILNKHEFKLCMVFTNMKYMAKEIAFKLYDTPYRVESFHGNLKQNKRSRIIEDFRNGKINILVATDIAARGIDIKGVDIVINYEPPKDYDFYVHRIGRTARAKTTGISFTLFNPRQMHELKGIEKKTQIQMQEFSYDESSLEVAKLNDKFEGRENRTERQPRHEFNRERENNDEQHAEPTNKISTRFFLNVGTMDGFDNGTLKQYMIKELSIDNEKIKDVYCKDKFSFVEVDNDMIDNLKKFTSYNDREIAVVVSNSRNKRNGGNGGFRDGGNRGFKPRFGGHDRNGGRGGFKPRFGGNDRGERSSFSDRPRFNKERGERGNLFHKKSFGDKPRFNKEGSSSRGFGGNRGGFNRDRNSGPRKFNGERTGGFKRHSDRSSGFKPKRKGLRVEQ
jgi:ATP-dependent RNA helicase DeaD